MECIYLKKMRNIFVVFILLMAVSVFAEVQVRDGKVTAHVQSGSLRDVVNQIATQAGIQVSIDDSVANDTIYANFQDLPIGAAMRKLLEGTDINYAVIGTSDSAPSAIFVSRSESPGGPPKKLDTRPVTSPGRGVVQPISPPPPPIPQQAVPTTVVRPPVNGANSNNVNPNKDPNQKPATPTGGTAIPTAGSFTGPPPQPENQPNRPGDKPLINQNNANADDSGDDDDDDDDE